MFSDHAIQFCLMVKVLFGLPLRQTTGMVSGILEMGGLDWPVPDFSMLSRRQKTLAVQIPHRRVSERLHLLVDSTEIKFLADGGWLARKHGTHRGRQYRKAHLATGQPSEISGRWRSLPAVRVTARCLDLVSQIPPDDGSAP